VTLRGTTQPLHLTHDVALIDLDGVLYKGPYAIEHAPESLTSAREGGLITRFVTNNAAREPQTVADHLTELGIVTKDTEVVTSAQAGAALLSERFEAGSRILVVGGKGLRTAVTERGFQIVSQADEDPRPASRSSAVPRTSPRTSTTASRSRAASLPATAHSSRWSPR
jgi:ribonucleotide monophosphatase NagD (HAD superfamily)